MTVYLEIDARLKYWLHQLTPVRHKENIPAQTPLPHRPQCRLLPIISWVSPSYHLFIFQTNTEQLFQLLKLLLLNSSCSDDQTTKFFHSLYQIKKKMQGSLKNAVATLSSPESEKANAFIDKQPGCWSFLTSMYQGYLSLIMYGCHILHLPSGIYLHKGSWWKNTDLHLIFQHSEGDSELVHHFNLSLPSPHLNCKQPVVIFFSCMTVEAPRIPNTGRLVLYLQLKLFP